MDLLEAAEPELTEQEREIARMMENVKKNRQQLEALKVQAALKSQSGINDSMVTKEEMF